MCHYRTFRLEKSWKIKAKVEIMLKMEKYIHTATHFLSPGKRSLFIGFWFWLWFLVYFLTPLGFRTCFSNKTCPGFILFLWPMDNGWMEGWMGLFKPNNHKKAVFKQAFLQSHFRHFPLLYTTNPRTCVTNQKAWSQSDISRELTRLQKTSSVWFRASHASKRSLWITAFLFTQTEEWTLRNVQEDYKISFQSEFLL